MRRASYFAFFIFILVASFVFYKPVFADVSIHVRYQDTIAFDGAIALPDLATTTLADSSGNPHDISSQSALYLLSLASASTTSKFSVSNLQYYPPGEFSSSGSLYLKCVDIIATTTIHACDNWQYAVNGIAPNFGSDQYSATTSDDIYFYFGSQRQFSVSTTSTDTATPVVVTAQKYDFTNNSWLPLSGTVVGATQPDPNNPWSPLVVASSTTAVDGTASILMTNAGIYNIGLQEDYYYPTTAVSVSSTTSQTDSGSAGENNGGGSGGGVQQTATFDVDKAVQFLVSQQKSDGSFGASLYTDWSAIGLAGYQGQSDAKQKLISYFISNPDNSSLATDAERHAMALMALGINPYSGTSVDYIKKITDQFDGTQIGDANLYNDDIFALFPLLKSGYSTSDSIIQKITAFIISKQSSDGSWGSVDMTSAGIQALSQVTSLPDVSSAINKAQQYLKSSQSNGSFGNSPATSWALQAIASLGQSPSQWQQGSETPLSFLAKLQQADGGVELASADANTRIWNTAYAIPTVLGKPWPSILSYFPKPAQIQNQTNQSSNSETLATSTTNTATSTAIITSTTTPISKIQITNPKPVSTVYPTQTPKNPEKPLIYGGSTSTDQTASIANAVTEKPDQKNNPWFLISGFTIVALGLGGFLFLRRI